MTTPAAQTFEKRGFDLRNISIVRIDPSIRPAGENGRTDGASLRQRLLTTAIYDSSKRVVATAKLKDNCQYCAHHFLIASNGDKTIPFLDRGRITRA